MAVEMILTKLDNPITFRNVIGLANSLKTHFHVHQHSQRNLLQNNEKHQCAVLLSLCAVLVRQCAGLA